MVVIVVVPAAAENAKARGTRKARGSSSATPRRLISKFSSQSLITLPTSKKKNSLSSLLILDASRSASIFFSRIGFTNPKQKRQKKERCLPKKRRRRRRRRRRLLCSPGVAAFCQKGCREGLLSFVGSRQNNRRKSPSRSLFGGGGANNFAQREALLFCDWTTRIIIIIIIVATKEL